MKRIWLTVAVFILSIGWGGCDSASDTGIYFRIKEPHLTGGSYLAVSLYEAPTPEGEWTEVTLQAPLRLLPATADDYRVLVTVPDSKEGKWFRASVLVMDEVGRTVAMGESGPVDVKAGSIRGEDVELTSIPSEDIDIWYPTGCIWRDATVLVAPPWDRDCDGFPVEGVAGSSEYPYFLRGLPPDCDETNFSHSPAMPSGLMEAGTPPEDWDCDGIISQWCWTFGANGICYGGFWEPARDVCTPSSYEAPADFCRMWEQFQNVEPISYYYLCYVAPGKDMALRLQDVLFYPDSDAPLYLPDRFQLMGLSGLDAWVGYTEDHPRLYGTPEEVIHLRLKDNKPGMVTLVMGGRNDMGWPGLRALKLVVAPSDGMEWCRLFVHPPEQYPRPEND